MKILLLMTLIPLFAGFSVSAFGFGAVGSHGTAKQRETERKARTDNKWYKIAFGIGNTRQIEEQARSDSSAIAREVEQWKSDYLRVKAENNHLKSKIRELKNGPLVSMGCQEEIAKVEKECTKALTQVNAKIVKMEGYDDQNCKRQRQERFLEDYFNPKKTFRASKSVR